jgi:hypothetical protein
MNHSHRYILFLAIIAVSLFSCNSSHKENKSQIKKQIEIDYESIDGENAQTYYRIPAPEEVMSQIDYRTIEYNDGMLSNPHNFKNYVSVKSQSLNMGVYLADLAYITLLEKNEASLDFYEALNGLSEQLRIKSALNDDLLKRISQNIGNTDSLLHLSRNAYNNIIEYLEDNNKEEIISLISIGMFIETLHICIESSGPFNPADQLIQLIVDQRFTFDNIYFNALIYKDNKNIADILPILKELDLLYKELEPLSSDTTNVSISDDNKIVLTGGIDYAINEMQFNQLKTLVDVHRNLIVNLK